MTGEAASGPATARSGPAIAPSGGWQIDRSFVGWSVLASAGAIILFGVTSAIIPNPVFGRQIPPEPFAIVVWLASGVLMGLVAATYLSPPPAVARPISIRGADVGAVTPAASEPASSGTGATVDRDEARRSLLGYAGGFAAFLAIGCPVCNKIALVLLGTSGALTVWAPLQPVIGALSLVLLAGTLAWRLRLRARGNACAVV